MRRGRSWWAYAAVAAAFAALAIGHWLWALAGDGPVLYGEGAVAHASILARDHLEYTFGARYGDVTPIFTAANYPPLYFHLAGFGDPFIAGRVVSIVASLFVAGAIVWRARAAGALVAAAIGLAWLGSAPVMQWGPAVKPDAIALALTVGAVLALGRERPMHALSGALIGLAVMAKPTALVPAAVLFIFVARRDPIAAVRALGAGLAAALVVALVTEGPSKALYVHVFDWNALPWRIELLVGLGVVAVLVLAVPTATMIATRPADGAITAYGIAAIGVLLLGGREGATVNYFLDLSAALALGAAAVAPRLALGRAYPVASLAQLVIGAALLNPFPSVPSLLQPTGKWSDPARAALVRDLPGTLLVEDSGLLVANGREPIVDDLFLWSRVYATGRSFLEGERLLAAIRAGTFDAIVSEVELEHMDAGPGYERQRWNSDLVTAVLERYQMLTRAYGLCQPLLRCQQLYVYTRRQP